MTTLKASSATAPSVLPRLSLTFIFGLSLIIACEILLFIDLRLAHRGPVHSQAAVDQLEADSPPTTPLGDIARFVAFNITPLAWFGYMFFIEGVLAMQGRSPVRKRPHHFALLFLASVFIWCVFDWINFYSIRAWRYIGMPPDLADRMLGYFIAFGAIVPGMLMSGQALLNAGAFNWARVPRTLAPVLRESSTLSPVLCDSTTLSPVLRGEGRVRGRLRMHLNMPIWLPLLSLIIGLAMFIWPLIHHDPITNLTLWTSLVFLLDPINLALGRPSMLRDWSNGWFGRTLAAFAGGLICGLLWEFWNYWALSKWVYHLPFLGAAENVRYFEMPVLGLLGFLPFGIECWIMWQLIRVPLDGLTEPLPGEFDLI